MDEVKAESITPTINKDVVDFTFKLKPKMMKENKIAPKIAAEIMEKLEEKIPGSSM